MTQARKSIENRFVPPRPGVVFRNGRLYVFKKRSVLVITLDRHGPRGFKKTAKEPFFRPTYIPAAMGASAVNLIASPRPEDDPFPPGGWLKAEASFIQAGADAEIIAQMARFTTDVYGIWSLAARVKEGLELIRENPALAYLLALNNVFMKPHARPWDRARALVKKTRRELLSRAGFAGTAAEVRMLEKIPSQEVKKSTLRILRHLLRIEDPPYHKLVQKVLGQLEVINRTALFALWRERPDNRIAPGLLIAMVNSYGQDPTLVHCARDIHRLSGWLRIPLPAKIRRPQELIRLAAQCRETMESVAQGPFPRSDIPDLVLPGTEIRAIRNGVALREWALRQRNCASSLAPQFARGELHPFRVMSGIEEATLAIRKTPDEGYVIDQLAGVKNCKVSPATRALVMQWLSGNIQNEPAWVPHPDQLELAGW